MTCLSLLRRPAAALGLVLLFTLHAGAGGASFTYQGRLTEGKAPLNTTCDLTFSLWNDALKGELLGEPQVIKEVQVVDDLFTTAVDFGLEVFDGSPLWLEVAVAVPAGSGKFETLAPRQPLTASPSALFATRSGLATTASTAALANSIRPGGVDSAALATGAVTDAKIAAGQTLKSLNGLRDHVQLTAGSNITLSTNGSTLQLASGPWQTSGSNAVLTSGMVGIGVANPGASLEVAGPVRIMVGGTSVTVNADGTVFISSSTNVTISTTADIQMTGRDVNISASRNLKLSGGVSADVSSSLNMNVRASGNLNLQGTLINLN